MREKEPGENIFADKQISSGRRTSNPENWEIAKVRTAIVALAVHHCESVDSKDLEMLGLAVASLGTRLKRLQEGVVL